MRHGKKHGFGKFLDDEDMEGCYYVGYFDENEPHGYGQTIFENGNIYVGQIRRGLA